MWAFVQEVIYSTCKDALIHSVKKRKWNSLEHKVFTPIKKINFRGETFRDNVCIKQLFCFYIFIGRTFKSFMLSDVTKFQSYLLNIFIKLRQDS